MSAFMNNVGALGLLMPAALQSARKAGRSPSVILMPLAERGISHGDRRDALMLGGIFAAAIGAASFGLLPTVIALSLAVVPMILLVWPL